MSARVRNTGAGPRIGTWLMLFYSPPMLSSLAEAGLDFIRLDMEHTPIEPADISRLVRMSAPLPMDICLRPRSGSRTDLKAALDTGARRLYVPQVETAAEAEAVAETVRNILSPEDPAHVSVMLESARAFGNCNEIAAVPGIDLLAMGPADLAQDLGIYGAADEAAVLDEYRYRLRDAALVHRKEWEMGVWSQEDARRWSREGCTALTFMTDTSALRVAYRPALAVMRSLTQSRAPA